MPVPEYTINRWNVTGNLLTLEVTGQTLERMNELGRQIERSPIVDSCTISTAKKDLKKDVEDEVQTRFIVYLQQSTETEEANEGSDAESMMPDFGAVTRFVGGEGNQYEGTEP